ncbi:hypothetical protein ROJ8625_01193 [Roseivivax jejudonensis]|uniref:Uncharacterized protein n=2 Tax=Roseivivax jejudonensis TaxID=1529041 RepID=A0A1X6YR01_9RHOB|nr:hypothetical protein ROJ8625_01193 [Roseivivax jejudonensis]
MPKCATTTVQDVLAENADWLAEHGVAYERHADDWTEGEGNAAVLGSHLLHNQQAKARRLLNFFLRGDGDVILSSEVLIACARARHFQWFVDEVAKRGFRLHVIVYLRRQDIWIESDFKQHVKSQNLWTGTLDDLIESRIERRTLDYHWVMRNWARFVGRENVSVVPLNRGQDPLYPARRFFELLEVPPPPDERVSTEPRNVSPPAGLIEAARFVKRAALREGLDAEAATFRVTQFIEDALRKGVVPTRRYLLDADTRRELLSRYERSNARLAREFLDGTPPFDPFEEEAEAEPGMSLTEEAADLLATLANGALRDPDAADAPQQVRRPLWHRMTGSMIRRK